MKTIQAAFVLASALALAGLVTSCRTASSEVRSAVTCDQCRTVWVQRPVQVGGYGKTGSVHALTSSKVMQCPYCESAVATFFKSGQLKHHCSHCGGALVHCTAH